MNYERVCSICGKNFMTKYKRQNICDFVCRQEATRRNARISVRKKRHKARHSKSCEICGYSLTTNIHHEGKETYVLCPNHHALITRGIKTIEEIKHERT